MDNNKLIYLLHFRVSTILDRDYLVPGTNSKLLIQK